MLLFSNGVIHTVEPDLPNPEAVLVGDDGRIAAVGARAALERPGVRQIDLAGRTLIPGFNDAHVHVSWLGMLMTNLVDTRIHVAPNIGAIVDRLAARAQTQPPGSWVEGVGYNETQLPEGRHLTRHDLDQASTAHPILLTRTCGHIAVANSLALRLAGIDAATSNPPGGVIVRDAGGAPTGVLQETAIALVAHLIPAPGPDLVEAAIAAAQRHQLSLGITSATDPDVTPDQIRVYRAMDARATLRVRMNLLAGRRSGEVRFPLPEVYVSDMLRIDGVKFFADGGMTSATAAISTPYRETGTTGVMIWEDEDLADSMWEAHSANLRIGTHANGDVAIEQVLKIYELLEQRRPGMRHRIEHLALPTPDQLARLRAIGTMAATQTVFLPAMGATFRRYMPEHFYARAYGVRGMLDAGLTVALSTDAPVVADDNPLLGLKSAIDRRDHAGVPLGPNQAITPAEALWAYTQAGAILSGDDHNRGSISSGKWADLAVLSGDPLTTPPDELLSLVVEQTYVAGQLAYERP
ncbi:MAG TPA: amidohydrolase [Roseiflexaceae bacterium]|nr:amidohydrolase [Roseiflexaceae bacterium]